ncbi:MAG: tetratricopeptide repeat protein [Burkholderiales bacterium]
MADVLREATQLHGAGRLDEAERAYLAVVAVAPMHFPSLHMLGVISAQRGRFAEARQRLAQALQVMPQSAEAHSDLGSVLKLMGLPEEALQSFARALAVRPDFVEALGNRAAVETELGRFADALATCDRVLALNAQWPDGWNNRGVALQGLARHGEALASFERALELRPGAPVALHNRAAALLALGRPADALESCERALARAPDYADALVTRGVALHELARHEEAIASFDRALTLRPRFAKALQNRGVALSFLRRHDEAARDLAAALALDASLPFADGALLRSRLQCCAWADFDSLRDRVVRGVRGGAPVCDPSTFLAVADAPGDALACAQIWARRLPAPSPLWRGERYGHDRIRVAYLSADLREHATAYLLAEVLERHDRSRFDVTAVSWGPAETSAMRARLVAAVERFVDVEGRGDEDVAKWLRAQEIDIAVDLKGYTFQGRPGILAHRPGPVQVSYLGYPGTLGMPHADYVIGDATVIPEGAEADYRESVIRLPDSYQPNDRQRAIAESTPARSALGLPARGFVFCSFNNTYKIVPEQFAGWMRLLREVEGSVLWLLEGNPLVSGNLRREAQARGVAGSRLVFAPRLPPAEHLARHRQADLFLDTLPCNAHTTASDALWAGLPVVTCLGRTFAGRVAGSLLRAAGLPELVTASAADYEALALRLARRPDELAALREKLSAHRLTCALFDSGRYVRHLESAYETMWARAQRGEPPRSFAVPANE